VSFTRRLGHDTDEGTLIQWLPNLHVSNFNSIVAPRQYLIEAYQCFLPEAFDFWKETAKLGSDLLGYAEEQLQNAAATFSSAKEGIDDFKVTMEKVVSDAQQFGDHVLHDGEELSEKFTAEAFAFWKEIDKTGIDLVRYAEEELQNAAATFTSAKERIDEFNVTIVKVVSSAKKFGDHVLHYGVNLEELSEMLATELDAILEELKAEFSLPLPGQETPRQAHRDKMISSALSKVEDAVVKVTGLWGIPEAETRLHFKEFEPHVKIFLLVSSEHILLTFSGPYHS
jgi:hydrogenase maturation factor